MKLPALSFAAPAPLPSRGTAAASTSAAAPLSPKEEIAARKLQEAKSAVAMLGAVKNRSSDAEKARAAQKVKELKARLQALKMIYATDPKKLAKAAAQIARELAGAVKSYTSAGGNTMELGGADASAGAGATPGAEGAAGADGAAAAEGAGAAAGAGAGAGTKEDAATSEDGDAKPAAPAANLAENGKDAATRGRDKADEDFARDARDLARALKAALRRKDPKHRDDSDQRSAEDALASVEQAVGALPTADTAVVSAVAAI